MKNSFTAAFYIFALLLPLRICAFVEDPGIEHPDIDDDLAFFRSRPDLRPPLIDVTIHDPRGISSGYWFMAPYSDLSIRLPTNMWIPGQVGPHIFDEHGELVWSGGHLSLGRAAFDFRVVYPGNRLSFIVKGNVRGAPAPGGYGVLMGSQYNTIQLYDELLETEDKWNMHEFNILPGGRTALKIVGRGIMIKEPGFNGPVHDEGIVEFDLSTGEILFEWWAMDHLSVSESFVRRPEDGVSTVWDVIHINSIDKDYLGNYLVSGRYMNCIYNVSKTGALNWKLGGSFSSFHLLDGLNFSGQHHARILSQGPTHSIISFLNNAGNQLETTSNSSAAFFVKLDFENWTARLIKKYDRPDGNVTHLRGNVQVLPSSVFICWSENGYISEHSLDGRLLFEARFRSRRFVTYRAYKFNFTGHPTEPPSLKAWIYGEAPDSSTTVTYVSWNGATHVAAWKFFGGNAQLRFLGQVAKTTFETTFTVTGCFGRIYAEAYASNGTKLGQTAAQKSVMPQDWQESKTCPESADFGSHAPNSQPSGIIIGKPPNFLDQLGFASPKASIQGLLIILVQFFTIIVLLILVLRGLASCILAKYAATGPKI